MRSGRKLWYEKARSFWNVQAHLTNTFISTIFLFYYWRMNLLLHFFTSKWLKNSRKIKATILNIWQNLFVLALQRSRSFEDNELSSKNEWTVLILEFWILILKNIKTFRQTPLVFNSEVGHVTVSWNFANYKGYNTALFHVVCRFTVI